MGQNAGFFFIFIYKMGKNPFSPKYKSIWDKDIELAKMKGYKVGSFVIAYEPSLELY